MPEGENDIGSNCFTSGLSKNTKLVEAIPTHVIDCSEDEENNVSSPDKLCAKLINQTTGIAALKNYQKDFGGPLICIDKENKKPILTGILSTGRNLIASNPSGKPNLCQGHNS